MFTSNKKMNLTPYQSQFLAHLLTLEGQAEETISRSISSAKVDMNPHQVEAALFALRSPLSKGVILADEVGLGKTIEASLVIAQRWAERKRNILLIVPATLRKQWSQELAEKFALPCEIIEAKNYNQAKKEGVLNPFDKTGKILIASYQFAAKKAADIKAIKWGLVVFDEAHKLRNIYKKEGSKTAKALCEAVNDRHKALLSATPLQNSLMELFGLVSVIDENFFGSEATFRSQFMASNSTANFPILKKRLEKICTRTLRRQVVEEGGIRFTRRHSLTQDFTPSTDEQKLYQLVSEYLQRDDIAAIKKGARHLVNLVIRKILASSSFAIGDTLKKMIDRLEKELAEGNKQVAVNLEDLSDYETAEEIAEEIENDEGFENGEGNEEADNQQSALKKEITELKEFRALAQGIRDNAKGEALIKVLDRAFEDVVGRGGARKAVIFTESVRTQQYLKTLLAENGYNGKMVLMNGSNTDPDSQAIYRNWLERHKGTDIISGSKSADTKASIVEAFKNDAEILIATESAAEGVNLQFCSLVINYDLPWNPQRVEQRIGRCHRYGQKSDVVVVNFINKANKADERVFQLLNKKFMLFDGVFGASDEILGAIESGVDIEQRIYSVFQECRTTEEIEKCFEKLEEELGESLEARDIQTRKVILENLDESVAARLKSRRQRIDESLSDFEKNLLAVTKAELPEAEFLNGKAFQYKGQIYSLNWKEAEDKGWHFYRLTDGSLAQQLVNQAKERPLEPATLRFEYEAYEGDGQLSDLIPLRGASGWIEVSKLTLKSLRTSEHLILVGRVDGSDLLPESQIKRLFRIPAQIISAEIPPEPKQEIDKHRASKVFSQVSAITEENKKFFDEESEKLDRWGDEKKLEVEQDINALEAEIRQARKGVRLLQTLEEKTKEKRRIKQLESKRDEMMMMLFERRKEVERKQEEMLDDVEAKMKIEQELTPLFTIRWELV